MNKIVVKKFGYLREHPPKLFVLVENLIRSKNQKVNMTLKVIGGQSAGKTLCKKENPQRLYAKPIFLNGKIRMI
jgi:hypothetical protein